MASQQPAVGSSSDMLGAPSGGSLPAAASDQLSAQSSSPPAKMASGANTSAALASHLAPKPSAPPPQQASPAPKPTATVPRDNGPPPTAGPVTRALSRVAVSRKRSIKRKAPPPPPPGMDRPTSPSSCSDSGGPPTPPRSQSSHQAARKLHDLVSPHMHDGRSLADTQSPSMPSLADYEVVQNATGPVLQHVYANFAPPLSPSAATHSQLRGYYQYPPYPLVGGGVGSVPPPSWGRGLNHSLSDGCVQRSQLLGVATPTGVVAANPLPLSGPLVPLVEETVSPDGALVPHAYYIQQQNLQQKQKRRSKRTGSGSLPTNNTPSSIAASANSDLSDSNVEDTSYGPMYYGNNNAGRLTRSDSVITVAHLCEDLYVVTPFIKVTLTNLTGMVVVLALIMPNTAAMLYTFFRLVFGTLFPAYYSYKAVKTKNVKEYVKWMMYWIVFAFFTCFETITDLFLAFWFPFYYELKILLVLWLLSPATRGSSVLYRKFVHPWLTQREEDIDACIARAKQQGYSTVLQLGTKGVNYATTVIMQTAIKGGGGIVNQLKRSYSVGELAGAGVEEDPHVRGDHNRNNVKAVHHQDATDHGTGTGGLGRSSSSTTANVQQQHVTTRRGNSTGRSSKTRSVDASDMYYSSSQDLSASDEPLSGGSMSTSVPGPGPSSTLKRRSNKHGDMSGSRAMAVPGATSYRKSRTGEVSAYATLPRSGGLGSGATKRASTKKRQV